MSNETTLLVDEYSKSKRGQFERRQKREAYTDALVSQRRDFHVGT
jgi:hypothetical protein